MAPTNHVAEAAEAIRATASGRVQGVGYRASVVDRARALGALGWVRNQDDGTVLMHAEGPAAAVEELVAFLRKGPPGAQVDAVDVRPAKVEGHEQFAIRGVSAGRFVVEEHPGAEAPSYVLRLEVDGAMRAWRVPKGPSMNPADKRFAIAIGPTPAPGVPPRDSDSADGDETTDSRQAAERDTPTTWDEGSYEQGGRVPWPEAIDRGHAVFVLHGDKLSGGFALQRTRGSGPRAGWLLIKRRDAEADAATGQATA